jgi:CheY-like chemotaxis protein
MKKQVLVVDDDTSVRESLKRVLSGAGYETMLARDGQEAIDRCSAEIDLSILDLDLPVKDGWETFEELTRRNPCLPIIIITGLSNQYEKALAVGAGALLEKPIEASALLRTMQELLEEKKEHRLRRQCGDLHDTRYAASPNTVFLKQLREKAAAPYHFEALRTLHPGSKI